MNTDSVEGRRVAKPGDIEQPGDFCFIPWDETETEFWSISSGVEIYYLFCLLPGQLSKLELNRARKSGWACGKNVDLGMLRSHRPTWNWDGNEDTPTLSPSMHHLEHWHGWLKAGRFESC